MLRFEPQNVIDTGKMEYRRRKFVFLAEKYRSNWYNRLERMVCYLCTGVNVKRTRIWDYETKVSGKISKGIVLDKR